MSSTPSEFFDAISGDYESIIPFFESVARVVVADLDPREGRAVLDIGAGSGHATRLFAEKVGPAGRVLALEPAPSLAARIRLKAPANVEVVQRSLREMVAHGSIGERKFDYVVATFVLPYLDDPASGLATAWSCVSSGGVLVISEPGLANDLWDFPAAVLSRTTDRHRSNWFVPTDVGSRLDSVSSVRRNLTIHTHEFATPDDCVRWLSTVGWGWNVWGLSDRERREVVRAVRDHFRRAHDAGEPLRLVQEVEHCMIRREKG